MSSWHVQSHPVFRRNHVPDHEWKEADLDVSDLRSTCRLQSTHHWRVWFKLYYYDTISWWGRWCHVENTPVPEDGWPQNALLSETAWHWCTQHLTPSHPYDARWYQFMLFVEQGHVGINSLSKLVVRKSELNWGPFDLGPLITRLLTHPYACLTWYYNGNWINLADLCPNLILYDPHINPDLLIFFGSWRLFTEILQKSPNANEIHFNETGAWEPVNQSEEQCWVSDSPQKKVEEGNSYYIPFTLHYIGRSYYY